MPKLETRRLIGVFVFILHPQKIQQYINNVYHSLRTDGLGSDQARLTIRPDMGPNCLQRLSTYKGLRLQEMSHVVEPAIGWLVRVC